MNDRSPEEETALSTFVVDIENLFECGSYREALALIAKALGSYPTSSALKLWQAIATDASGDTETAIELVRPLTKGGDRETRKQAHYLLKIWQAPRLARPEIWMTDVPSVKTSGDRATVVLTGAVRTSTQKDEASPQSTEQTQEESVDSALAQGLPGWWIAMAAIAGILLGMLILGRLA